MEDKTLKDLQIEAVKLGIPEEAVKTFTNKAPLIVTINALKAKEVVEKVSSLRDPLNPGEEKRTNKNWYTKAMIMRDQLDRQPKVRFFLPLEPKEKPGVVKKVMVKGRQETVHVSGAIETVTLNGYKEIIPKGVFYDVAQQIADILSESLLATQSAGKDFLADRIDPEMGGAVSERL